MKLRSKREKLLKKWGLALNEENLRLLTTPNRAAKKQGFVKKAGGMKRTGGRF